MPNGSLTPLGRQLRSVLVNLSRPSRAVVDTSSPRAHLHHAVAPVEAVRGRRRHLEAQEQEYGIPSKKSGASLIIARGGKKIPKEKHDFLREALGILAAQSFAAFSRPGAKRLSFSNVGNKMLLQKPPGDHDGAEIMTELGVSLRKILLRWIKHTASTSTPFVLRAYEATFLLKQNYKPSDIEVWGSALVAPDAFDAAMILERHIQKNGWRAVPFMVRQYLLYRPYIKPAALKLLLRQTEAYLHARYKNGKAPRAAAETLFKTFKHLVHHARTVWPQALPSIADMILDCLCVENFGTTPQQKTSMLNKAMDLISRPCAIHPVKNAVHNEAAVFHVLRGMAEHDPPIVLIRSGYRAVVRVQLSRKKTAEERQWAELKALSWPPWKVERTSKDSAITAAHGMSRAGNTLARMREAGYAPWDWEKSASIYTGWDTDGTPSIQTRVSTELDFSNASIWAARIRATRTVQEAWAAYLAFEDADHAPADGVHLAIFEKLFAEEERIRIGSGEIEFSDVFQDHHGVKLLPGDVKEIAAPPPSSHLHTYTRTVPPTVLEFFETLEARGVSVGGQCLAFIVSNAASLSLGFRYLQYGQGAHPGIQDLLLESHGKIPKKLTEAIVAAIIELLCRNSVAPLRRSIPGVSILQLGTMNEPALGSRTLNPYHTVVCAMGILRFRAPTFRPAYTSVLGALCRKSMHVSIPRLFTVSEQEERHDLEMNGDFLVIYRLFVRTLSLMDAVHIPLDALGVFYLCVAAENVTMAFWKIMKFNHDHLQAPTSDMSDISRKRTIINEVQEWLRRGTVLRRVKHEFAALVGQNIILDTGSQSAVEREYVLPRLLTIPHPWLLHAYVRTNGWMGDYEALRMTISWMTEHRAELATAVAKDRNGETLMRKVFVSLRVFLERSWLSDIEGERKTIGTADPQALDQADRFLHYFERPASPSTINEIKQLVEDVEEWCGWPTEEEVELYCQHERFVDIRNLYK